MFHSTRHFLLPSRTLDASNGLHVVELLTKELAYTTQTFQANINTIAYPPQHGGGKSLVLKTVPSNIEIFSITQLEALFLLIRVYGAAGHSLHYQR